MMFLPSVVNSIGYRQSDGACKWGVQIGRADRVCRWDVQIGQVDWLARKQRTWTMGQMIQSRLCTPIFSVH